MININDFNRRFPDNNACLEYLKNILYPDGIYCKNCKRVTKHHKVKSRPSYSCDYCGHHIYPKANTMFHKSTTPLRYWFYSVYLMSDTRISAKQLQKELGVTYKTAWRMFHKIKEERRLRNLREGGELNPELQEQIINTYSSTLFIKIN